MGTHKCTLSSDGVLVVRGEFTSGRSGGFDETWVRVSAPTRGGEPDFRREPPVLPPGELVPPPRGEPTPPRRELAPPPRGEPTPPSTPEKGRRPKVGEYVYVEELPVVAAKVSPSYPEEARKKRIQGTVLVQALVLEDGRVGDCFVQKSVPELDEAAIAAVRQWVFKPALTKGKPIAVWVAVPVRFTLH
jgi:protein TonB